MRSEFSFGLIFTLSIYSFVYGPHELLCIVRYTHTHVTVCLSNLIILLIHIGLFLTNVASQNKEMRTEILKLISGTYPSLVSIPIPEDINEVVVGLPSVASSQTDCDHKVPMPVSAILELDSIEVKNTLAKLAAVVS